jgi:hypothetical protein
MPPIRNVPAAIFFKSYPNRDENSISMVFVFIQVAVADDEKDGPGRY